MKHLIQEAEAQDKESSLAGIVSTVYVVSWLSKWLCKYVYTVYNSKIQLYMCVYVFVLLIIYIYIVCMPVHNIYSDVCTYNYVFCLYERQWLCMCTGK